MVEDAVAVRIMHSPALAMTLALPGELPAETDGCSNLMAFKPLDEARTKVSSSRRRSVWGRLVELASVERCPAGPLRQIPGRAMMFEGYGSCVSSWGTESVRFRQYRCLVRQKRVPATDAVEGPKVRGAEVPCARPQRSTGSLR